MPVLDEIPLQAVRAQDGATGESGDTVWPFRSGVTQRGAAPARSALHNGRGA